MLLFTPTERWKVPVGVTVHDESTNESSENTKCQHQWNTSNHCHGGNVRSFSPAAVRYVKEAAERTALGLNFMPRLYCNPAENSPDKFCCTVSRYR